MGLIMSSQLLVGRVNNTESDFMIATATDRCRPIEVSPVLSRALHWLLRDDLGARVIVASLLSTGFVSPR
jgi:hypothetical protein